MSQAGQTERARFHSTTPNGRQFNVYDFISEIFHLVFLDRGWPRASETAESGTADKWGLLYVVAFNPPKDAIFHLSYILCLY